MIIAKRLSFYGANMPPISGFVFALAVFATLFAVTAPVCAGSGGQSITANAPFDFYLGDRHFPAGKYRIEDGTGPILLTSIQLLDGEAHGSIVGIRENGMTTFGRTPSLLFIRYPDGKNYLREVRNSFFSDCFPRSRIERESATKLIVGVEPTRTVLLACVR